jgi:hypothetical protein
MLPVSNFSSRALSGSDLLRCGASICVNHKQMHDLLQPAFPTSVEFTGRGDDRLQLIG